MSPDASSRLLPAGGHLSPLGPSVNRSAVGFAVDAAGSPSPIRSRIAPALAAAHGISKTSSRLELSALQESSAGDCSCVYAYVQSSPYRALSLSATELCILRIRVQLYVE